ncbi:MAG: GAF domain-containing protein, partial [Ilumatobacteraceae bacterium]
MEIDTNRQMGAESAALLMLEVADAFVDATEHDRCLVVMMMCTEVTGVRHAAVGISESGTLRPVVASSAAVMALESFPDALTRESVSNCVAAGSVVTAQMHPCDVPFDGHSARALNLGIHHEYVVPLASRSGVHGVVCLYDGDELGRGRNGLG